MTAVSVVIPTRHRPQLVERALASALNQTFRDLEVIVVVDGPDDGATEQFLESMARKDPRLRVTVNPVNAGLAEARNIGVRASRGDWIAFLDDDDEWAPTKIEKQLVLGNSLGSTHALVVCKYWERLPAGERIWPETLPTTTDRFSEYMYCNRGMLVPSTYMVSRQLMLEIPFTKGLRNVEDIDWLLRATKDPRTKVAGVDEPCAVYANVSDPMRLTAKTPWREIYVWGIEHRDLFSPIAFSLYIVKSVVPRAKVGGASARELLNLLATALLLGSLNLRVVFFFCVSAFFSPPQKQKLRECFSHQARKAWTMRNTEKTRS